MLRQILERLRSGGTWTVEGLARELDTSPALVEAAIADLVRRGYLALVGGACDSGACDAGACTSTACGTGSGSGCAACSASGSCVLGGTRGGEERRVWTLTR